MRLYVASSWRNKAYPAVVLALRAAGFEVYDFRNPGPDNYGFSWAQIDPNWQSWTVEQYRAALTHPIAERGFGFDMRALEACDACVLVLPCGRSAHLELGYAVGDGKKTFVLQLEPQEPELMVKMCTGVAGSVDELVEMLGGKVPPVRALVPDDDPPALISLEITSSELRALRASTATLRAGLLVATGLSADERRRLADELTALNNKLGTLADKTDLERFVRQGQAAIERVLEREKAKDAAKGADDV